MSNACLYPHVQQRTAYSYGCRCTLCAAAAKEYGRKYYTSDVGRESSRRSSKIVQTKRKRKLAGIKLAMGCFDCGYKEHDAALEFDHREPAMKEFTIADNVNLAWARVLAEVDKCDVVCANCHRVRTFNRRKAQT